MDKEIIHYAERIANPFNPRSVRRTVMQRPINPVIPCAVPPVPGAALAEPMNEIITYVPAPKVKQLRDFAAKLRKFD